MPMGYLRYEYYDCHSSCTLRLDRGHDLPASRHFTGTARGLNTQAQFFQLFTQSLKLEVLSGLELFDGNPGLYLILILTTVGEPQGKYRFA